MTEWLELTPLLLSGAFLLGLLIGSFLNVVIFRVPARLEFEWRCQCEELLGQAPGSEADSHEAPPGIVFPPSACPSCGHRIKAHENIPIISYLLLRGRCKGCGTRISIRYPITELLTGAAFFMVAWTFGPTMQCVAGMVFTAFLIALSFIDLDHQLLPDSLVYPLLWGGLLLSLAGIFTDSASSILGAVLGYGIFWITYHAFRLLTGKEGMGYGDFKLLGALGAWLGWTALPMLILLSSAVGAIIGVAQLVLGKAKLGEPLPFGPFIAIAGWVALIWGDRITASYQAFLGL